MKVVDVTVSRLIPGPIADVFDVWLDAKSVGGPWFDAKKVVMTPEVDGLFYLAGEHEGRLWPHYGRFIAIDKPSKIQHTWMSESTRGLETIVTLTFAEKPDGTLVTIVHAGVPDDEMGRSHQDGWSFVLGALVERFARRS